MNQRVRQIAVLIIPMWVVFLINSFTFFDLNNLGIRPRDFSGLLGIFFSPFLHGNLNHILSNTFPLLGLLIILSLLYSQIYWRVVFGSIIIGGFLVWLLASRSIHIGASGLVFALASFLLMKTFKENKWVFLSVLVIMLIFYGNLWIGLIPFWGGARNISYSSHWYGFIAGIVMAIILQKHRSILTKSQQENLTEMGSSNLDDR